MLYRRTMSLAWRFPSAGKSGDLVFPCDVLQASLRFFVVVFLSLCPRKTISKTHLGCSLCNGKILIITILHLVYSQALDFLLYIYERFRNIL